MDPLSVQRAATPSTSYVLRRRYGRARYVIAVASWVTVINLLFQPLAALAATRNWDGDADTAWATAGNWDTAPVNDLTTDIANFNLVGPYQAASTPRHPNAGTVSINGITIGASNGAMTLSGTALSIGASGITIASGAGAVTISSPITIGASQSWANNSANTLTVSGNVASGANTLTINGTGTHTFEPGASVTGLTVANGTVNFNSTVASTYNANGVQTFTTAGFTTFSPGASGNYTVELWGGGGGGYWGGGGSRLGGGGGYTTGTLAMTFGKTYQIMVGGGGLRIGDGAGAGPAVFGGGGLAGTLGYGGQGGGLSGIFDTTYAYANALAIAGGGGGAGYFSAAGAGGGASGMNGAAGANSVYSTGGSQTAGGVLVGSNSGNVNFGTQLTGGSCLNTDSGGGGGGGGGYWGGGGGSNGAGRGGGEDNSGGGGSGFIGGLTGASTTAGSGRTPGNTTSPNYNGTAGYGGQGVNDTTTSYGAPGQVTITGPTVTGGATVTLTGGTINFGSSGGGANVHTLDVSAGTGTARADYALPLTIASQLKLPDRATATISAGNTFTAAGGNLANNSTARTLTLSGGTQILRSVSSPPTSGLLRHWTFDTDASDSSGNNGYSALLNSADVVTTGGKFGGYLNLPNANSELTIGTGMSNGPRLSANFTLSAWYQNSTATGYRTLWRGLDNAPSGIGDHHVLVNTGTDNLGMFGQKSGGAFLQAGTATIPGLHTADNTWRFMAVVYDGTALKYYTDNGANLTLLGTITKTLQENYLKSLGNHAVDSQRFATKIDDAWVYNRALTSDELLAVMRGSVFCAVSLPATVIAVTATSTLDLGAATSDHTLGKFSVVGGATLTIANAASVTLPGMSGTSIAATGTGAAAIAGTATLYPAGDISATGASLSITPPIVINTSGTRNVSGSVTVASLDLSSGTGTVNANASPLAISNTLKVNDGDYGDVTGTYTAGGGATSFSASGSDLASAGASRTFTLGGGKLTLTARGKADNSGTGGTIEYVGSDVIHKFTSTDSWSVPYAVTGAKVLVVGGGGGGGGAIGGGGGGGAVAWIPSANIPSGTYTATVGGSVSGGSGQASGSNGNDSTLTIGSTVTAKGGGGGGYYANPTGANGNSGGSGGGAGATQSTIPIMGGDASGTSFLGGFAGSIYGNRGGNVQTAARGGNETDARGGGGAGVAATDGVAAAGAGGDGGAGKQISALGGLYANYYWGGGGGGGSYSTTDGNRNGGAGGMGGGGGGAAQTGSGGAAGTGGLNVGGGGSNGANSNGGDAGANTGGGGGGGTWQTGRGGAGGSGIVIVQYARYVPGVTPYQVNLPKTDIAVTATSTLDLGAETKDHILGNITVTAGASANTTLTVDNVNSLTIGTLITGINAAYYGKLDLGTKILTLNGATKLAVTSVSPTVKECCVAVAAGGSFTGLHGTQVIDNTGKKWNVEVRGSGTELWLVATLGGTVIMFR